jgi:nucleoside diphosphate kinase
MNDKNGLELAEPKAVTVTREQVEKHAARVAELRPIFAALPHDTLADLAARLMAGEQVLMAEVVR